VCCMKGYSQRPRAWVETEARTETETGAGTETGAESEEKVETESDGDRCTDAGAETELAQSLMSSSKTFSC
jgi:hypothetical protein